MTPGPPGKIHVCVSSSACMWACVLLVACSVNHNPWCMSRFLLPQWSLPETRGWQVWVGSASQPCRADAIPTLQMGPLRLAEVKGPAWDSRPDSRGCRHSSSVPPPLWKMGLWFSSPRPLKEETCPRFADSRSHILHWSCGAWGAPWWLGGQVGPHACWAPPASSGCFASSCRGPWASWPVSTSITRSEIQ